MDQTTSTTDLHQALLAVLWDYHGLWSEGPNPFYISAQTNVVGWLEHLGRLNDSREGLPPGTRLEQTLDDLIASRRTEALVSPVAWIRKRAEHL